MGCDRVHLATPWPAPTRPPRSPSPPPTNLTPRRSRNRRPQSPATGQPARHRRHHQPLPRPRHRRAGLDPGIGRHHHPIPPRPDGTNALTLTTSSNPPRVVTRARSRSSTPTATTPSPCPPPPPPEPPSPHHQQTTAALTGGGASFTHYDEYGNPQTPATTPNDPKATLATFGSLYGYLATWQRPTQPTSGLTHMGARTYNPVAGTFTTTDPIPDGNTNPTPTPKTPKQCRSHRAVGTELWSHVRRRALLVDTAPV